MTYVNEHHKAACGRLAGAMGLVAAKKYAEHIGSTSPELRSAARKLRALGDPFDEAIEIYKDAKYRRDAQHDPLTGLKNISTLHGHLEEVIQRHQRLHDGSPNTDKRSYGRRASDVRPQSAVLFIDVDSFKALNDTYGHDAGDELLINIANTLQESARPMDFIVRKGGDEFIMVLDDITPDPSKLHPTGTTQEETVVERYRNILEHVCVDVGNGTRVACPVSIGIKAIKSNHTPESVIKDADESMYKDKARAGSTRSCVTNLIVKHFEEQRPSARL